MKLSEILKDVAIENSITDDIEVTDLCFDSRAVTKGALFACLKWMDIDGHTYVKAAVENGASVILAEDKIDAPCEVIYVKDSKAAFALMSANFYGHPADSLKLIGVTGTNGKTTVSHLVRSVLEFCNRKTGLIGTNNNIVGSHEVKSKNSTPFPNELHAIFREMADYGDEFAAMEVTSHALSLKRVWGLRFEVAAFTNLTEDHLDFHHDMESYFNAKKLIIPMAKTLLVNEDDPYGKRIKEENHPQVKTFSCQNPAADYFADEIVLTARGVLFTLVHQNKRHEIRLQIPGSFSVYNALCASSICCELGISLEDIEKGLMLVRGVMGRAEVVPTGTDYTVIIDYAHSPDSLQNIITTVKEFCKGRVITVFGCGGDRDPIKRPIMGRIAGKLSDFCVVTSDNPRTEDPHKIVLEVLEGVKEVTDQYQEIDNRKEAIGYALSIAQKDDVVLLAGKGHETYQILGKTKIDFDERKIVKEFLNQA